MHVLSVADIQLIVDLYETQDVLHYVSGRERQVDSLVRMGYLRPMRGIFTLTELGEKTAHSLQARRFVQSRAADALSAVAHDNSVAAESADTSNDASSADAPAEAATA